MGYETHFLEPFFESRATRLKILSLHEWLFIDCRKIHEYFWQDRVQRFPAMNIFPESQFQELVGFLCWVKVGRRWSFNSNTKRNKLFEFQAHPSRQA